MSTVACSLIRVGHSIVVAVEGLDPVSFESKSFEWDLKNLEFTFADWGVPTLGPVFEMLHGDLQSIWGEQVPTKIKDKRLLRRSTQPPEPQLLGEGPHMDLLRDPHVVKRIIDATTAPGSADPLIGESSLVMQTELILLGKGSEELRGETAGGKQAVVRHALSVWGPKTVLSVEGGSDKMLRYIDEGVKILVVNERRGLEGGKRGKKDDSETTLEYDLKLSISEGRVKYAIVEMDLETKKNKLVIHEHQFDSILITTTEVTGPAEYENRIFVGQIDDTEAQNKRVRDSQLADACSFSWNKRDWTGERKVVADALAYVMQHAPAPEDVLVPWAGVLTDMLPTGNTAVRRTTPKILKLIKASARLHYLQRTLTPDGKGVVASPEDLVLVLSTSKRAFEIAQEGISEKARVVYEIIQELADRHADITSDAVYRNADTDIVKRKAQLGSRDTVYRCMQVLAKAGAITATGEKQGKFNKYELGDALKTFGGVKIGKLVRAAREKYDQWLRRGAPFPQRRNDEPMGPDFIGVDRKEVNPVGEQSEPLNPNPVGSPFQRNGTGPPPLEAKA